jgi:FixJ family two-component response regulator
VSTHRGTIFVVDDDPSVRRGLARLLRAAGYDVATAASAREFLERRGFESAACVVLDVRMPGLSGFDLHDVIMEAGHYIPVVFITGHGDTTLADRAMKAGALDFLAKPVDDQALLDAVDRAIVARGLR